MTVINNQTKHKKYEKDWRDTVKAMVGKELETKLTELATINQELQAKKKTLLEVKLAIKHIKGTERELTRLENNDPAVNSANFRTKWQTEGWDKKVQDFYQDVKDNIYQAKVNNSDIETTEEQIINTVARVVKAFEKIDITDFTTKYNAKENDATKRKKVKDTLDIIKGWGAEIVIGNNQDKEGNAKQPTYDFANTYLKGKWNQTTSKWENDTTTPWTATSQFNYQEFGEFLELVKATDFLSDLDADKQKDVPQQEDWKIFLKGNKYKKKQLADYGIIIAETKTSLYKTDPEKSQTFKVENGLKDWIKLAQAVLPKANYEKLNKNFTQANNPNQLLLHDGKTYDGTGSWMFPESLEAVEDLLIDLEAEKTIKASNIKLDDIQTKERGRPLHFGRWIPSRRRRKWRLLNHYE